MTRPTDRVALACHSYPPRIGGLEQHVARLAAGLSQQGFSPVVLTPRYSSETASEERDGGVRVLRLGLGERTSPAGLLSKALGDPLMLKRWTQAIEAIGPEIVHLHAPYSPMFSTIPGLLVLPTTFMKVIQGLRYSVVVTFHGLCSDYSSDLLGHDRKHAKAGKLFIGVDRTICTGLHERFHIESDRIAYIPNGVDTTRFRPRPRPEALMSQLGLTQENRVILVPRRIDRKNGIEFAVKAFATVSKRRPEARLVLLGFQSPTSNRLYGESILSLVRGLGLSDRVICHGAVAAAEMPFFYNLASLAVIPSLWEATSLAALEAMASGVPIVASSVGGIPEVVSETAGLLFRPGDAEALSTCALRLLQDEELAATLSRGGVARSEQFSLSRMIARTIEVYRRAVST